MKIQIKNLTKIYGTQPSSVLALSELELSLAEQEICIVRGPNGSGKSTLISILSGEEKQSVGTITLTKSDQDSPKVVVVKQFENLVPELTLLEHFERFNRLENSELINSDILHKFPNQISRGQAQIAAIALALGEDTDLLLADEPTGALGHADSRMVYDFIQLTAKKYKCAVVLVTHDKEAERIADRVVRLKDGRISETWKPNESEFQVVNTRGWLRLPETFSTGSSNSVQIEKSEFGAKIIGEFDSKNLINEISKIRETSEEVLISAQDLSTFYSDVEVSKNLNFVVKSNDLFCIFGNSGSGKSTLLRTIAGLHSGFTGALTHETQATIPYYNIEQPFGLELNLYELGVNNQFISDLALADFASRPTKTYSGGQLQRAIVAIALSNPANIVELDEPTSALDDEMTELVIAALINSPKTLIVSSHDDRLRNHATQVIEL